MVGQRIDGDGHRMKTSVTGLENYNYPPCHSEGCAQFQNMPTITEKGVEVASVMCVQISQEGLDNEAAHALGVGPMETKFSLGQETKIAEHISSFSTFDSVGSGSTFPLMTFEETFSSGLDFPTELPLHSAQLGLLTEHATQVGPMETEICVNMHKDKNSRKQDLYTNSTVNVHKPVFMSMGRMNASAVYTVKEWMSMEILGRGRMKTTYLWE